MLALKSSAYYLYYVCHVDLRNISNHSILTAFQRNNVRPELGPVRDEALGMIPSTERTRNTHFVVWSDLFCFSLVIVFVVLFCICEPKVSRLLERTCNPPTMASHVLGLQEC